MLTMLSKRVIKNIQHSKKSSKEKKRRERQRRERPEENKKRIFSTISKILPVNGETPIQEVNVDALNILKGEANQLAEKKKKNRKNDGKKAYITDLACELSKSTCPASVTTAAATLVLPPVDQRTKIQSNSLSFHCGRTGIHYIYSMLCSFVMPSF